MMAPAVPAEGVPHMEILGPIPIDLNLDMVQTKLRAPDRDSVVKLMQEALALAEAPGRGYGGVCRREGG